MPKVEQNYAFFRLAGRLAAWLRYAVRHSSTSTNEPARPKNPTASNIRQAIVCEARDGTIQSWNPDAERIFGYNADDVVGKPASILRRNTNAEILDRVGSEIAAELDLDQVVRIALHGAIDAISASAGAFLYNLETRSGRPCFSHVISGIDRETFNKILTAWPVDLLDPVLKDRVHLRHEDAPAAHPAFRNLLVVPVVTRSGEVHGAVLLGRDRPGAFTADDEHLLSGIAARAAAAIDNARLYTAATNAGLRMTHQALHDSLTGLPNRSLFLDRVERCIRRSRRDPAFMFAVLFLDLDRFKLINDSLGHAVGDRLLTWVARRLESTLRETDSIARDSVPLPGGAASDSAADEKAESVARLGGDEFTILLDTLHSPEAAAVVAERILDVLAQPIDCDGQEVHAAASIGIAVGNAQYQSAMALLRDADIALYRAKAAGKGCYALFDATMHKSAVDRLRIEADLRRALEREELYLQYQPIVSLQTRELDGFEALVRWKRNGKIVNPADFIPIAEDIGMIVPMGVWILEQACRQLAMWRERYPSHKLSMNINVSGRQLKQTGLLRHLERVIEETGLDPGSIKLEITESVVMEDAEQTLETLRQIKATGVMLSMDDFGTGYSSLSCLHRFPIDVLKVDRGFLQNLEGRHDTAAVLQAIVVLAHNLGMRVVAEGIERPEQLAFLQGVDCDLGQGYLFSRPLAPEFAEAMITTPLTLSMAG